MSQDLAVNVRQLLHLVTIVLFVSPLMLCAQGKSPGSRLVQISHPSGSKPFDASASLHFALQTLGRGGGTIEFATAGIYNVSSTISLDDLQALQIRCAVGASRAAADHQVVDILYTGKAGSLFTAHGIRSLEIDHCNLGYSNPNYTGTLIDLSGSSEYGDTSDVYIHDNRIGGISTTRNEAAALIFLRSSDQISIERNYLTGAKVGILGPSNTIIAANMVTIRGNYFTAPFGDVAIRAGGSTWAITGNVFEPKAKDTCGAFDTTRVGVLALTFRSNWIGDGHFGTCIAASEGPVMGGEITGNEIEGAEVGINLGRSDGIVISGNHFEILKLGIDASHATHLDVAGNSFSGSVPGPDQVHLPAVP